MNNTELKSKKRITVPGSAYPILEHDNTQTAMIEPSQLFDRKEGFDCCVITFFRTVLEAMEAEGRIRRVHSMVCETLHVPVYEMEYEGRKIHLALGVVGAPSSAAFLEELIANGFSKFIVCGAAGVLQNGITVGKLIIPTSAVRDEGVSYHYLKPSREVQPHSEVLDKIVNYFEDHGIAYVKGKTWTTDAIYRETAGKIAMRKKEGCLSVEMEAAALFAVAQFRKVLLGQILYGGDDLSGVEWDDRNWHSRVDVKRNLVDIAIRICSGL